MRSKFISRQYKLLVRRIVFEEKVPFVLHARCIMFNWNRTKFTSLKNCYYLSQLYRNVLIVAEIKLADGQIRPLHFSFTVCNSPRNALKRKENPPEDLSRPNPVPPRQHTGRDLKFIQTLVSFYKLTRLFEFRFKKLSPSTVKVRTITAKLVAWITYSQNVRTKSVHPSTIIIHQNSQISTVNIKGDAT